MKSLLSALVAALLSLFGLHQSIAHAPPISAPPLAAYEQQPASLAAVAASFETPDAASTTIASGTPSIASDTTPSQPIIERIIEYASSSPLSTANFVTQDELTQQLQALTNSLTTKLNATTTPAGPEWLLGDGNPLVPYAAVSNISNLSGVTITNANLTASEIPALDYFPATDTVSVSYGGTGVSSAPSYGQLLLGNGAGGYSLVATSSLGISGGGSSSTPGGSDTEVQFDSAGTLAGSGNFTFSSSTDVLAVTGASTTNATSTNLFASLGDITTGIIDSLSGNTLIYTVASTTNSSNVGTAYFGGTATTTIDGAGDLAVAGNTTLRNATTTSLFVSSALTAPNASFGMLTATSTLSISGTSAFTGLATFTNASTSIFSVYGPTYFGATATSSFNSAGQLTLANLASAVLAVNSSDQVIATTSIGTNVLAGTLGTINGTTLDAGGSVTITAASSTLLGDNNTFSGADSFTNASSNFAGTWQTFTPSHFQTAGTYLSGLGNYATTTGTTISISTSTLVWNGLTLGNSFSVSGNGITVTPNVSGTISNSGLASSTIHVNGAILTLGDTNDTITAASSTLLANNNTWTGLQNFSNATSSLLSATTAWIGTLNLTNPLTPADGGTGINSTPSYGQLLLGNGSGGYNLVATSSLGISGGSSLTGTAGQVAYFSGTNTAVGTSSLYVASSGDLGIGTTIPIDELQISGLANPVEASSTNFAEPFWLYVQGRYAYVVGSGGLGIFDISNPAAPTKIASTLSGLTFDQGVYVQGRYAYVADENNGLVIFDISNPAAPTKVGSTTNGLNNPQAVYVEGRYAYVLSLDNQSLVVLDISNPASPTKIGAVSGLNGASTFYVQGRYAYVAANNGLEIFDISNPAAPTEVGSTTSGLSGPYGVYVQGRYAYVGDEGNNSLVIFDISNPAAPTEVGSTTSGLNSPQAVYVQGRYAYVADYYNGLVVFDISNPAAPTEVGSTTSGLSGAYGVYVQGRYAYVVSQNSRLVTFGIGGAYVQSIEAGTLQAGSLEIDNNLQALDGEFQGGLTVGNNLNVGGSFDLTASTFNATTTAGKNYSIFSINTASSSVPIMTALYNGNVGIGTTSSSVLLGVGSASVSGAVSTFVNSTGSCTINPTTTSLSCSSDERLKKNINSISTSTALADLMQLDPVYFNWNSEATGTPLHAGFIAQAVQPIFPDLVSTDTNEYLELNYAGFVPYITAAIQSITVISATFEQNLIAWLGNAQNGVTDLYATILHANELCLTDNNGTSCYTRSQLDAAVATANTSQSPGQGSSNAADTDTAETSSDNLDASSTPPIIQINGDNPTVLQVGDTYNDLGATITGPRQDLNLGITTYVNGVETSPMQIDTSAAATDTIDYVVTDQNGLTATSTRTVIVEALSIVPTDDASTTQATSAAQ